MSKTVVHEITCEKCGKVLRGLYEKQLAWQMYNHMGTHNEEFYKINKNILQDPRKKSG